MSCGGSSTTAPPTAAQNDGASAEGSSGGQPDAMPSQADAALQDATMVDGNAADAQGDLFTADGPGAPDSSVRPDATAVDAQSADADSIDASVDARDDAVGVIVDSSSDGDATFYATTCGMVVSTSILSPLICYPQCFPLEAGALAKIDAGDGGLTGTQCDSLCGTGGLWLSCRPVDDAGVSLIQCQRNCTGRRPAGLLPSPPGSGTALGAHFAEMARLEAAAVDAFHHLRRELIAHRAPRRMVKAAERAARDEIRHARMTRALAKRYGGGVVAPRVELRPVRSLEAIAMENAVEGCLREAFGALVAHWQASAAADPVIRAAMARIARDETRHAALAFEVDSWVRGRLARAAQARVAVVRDRAFRELTADEAEAPAALRRAIGLPTRLQSRLLLEQLARIAA
jgi:hypothetical protein